MSPDTMNDEELENAFEIIKVFDIKKSLSKHEAHHLLKINKHLIYRFLQKFFPIRTQEMQTKLKDEEVLKSAQDKMNKFSKKYTAFNDNYCDNKKESHINLILDEYLNINVLREMFNPITHEERKKDEIISMLNQDINSLMSQK
jgi:hypothetical protein